MCKLSKDIINYMFDCKIISVIYKYKTLFGVYIVFYALLFFKLITYNMNHKYTIYFQCCIYIYYINLVTRKLTRK